MKKKILLISSILLTLSITTIIIINNMDTKENNIISNVEKNKQLITNNMLTLMYETESGSGEYIETKDTTWPESGYIFNETLSGCENGGELEYNSGNNTVNLLSNSSDKCYVYFDKYDGVWIDNVSITNVTGSSVTLDVSATSENGSISKYYYALNDSEEYQETTTNPITITDLNKLTEYKIKIYAVDSTNAKSNIYEVSVSTTDESKPVINSVRVSNITDSGFTLTVNATSDVEIKRYYYIIESNNMSGTNTNNSYIFTGLDSKTSYDIAVFIENVNGIYSNKFNITVKTDDGVLLADYIKGLYTSQGANGIYYHTSSLANGAGDNSYRYSGANPNNYVCFGSDASTCPSDNLYRIIGVFEDEVKLIKADYTTTSQTGSGGAYYGAYSSSTSYYKGDMNTSNIATYYWNLSGSNTWSSSSLTTTNLNTTFLNSFEDNTWKDKIVSHTWKVGGMTYQNGYSSNAKTAYNYEVGSNSSSTIWSGKIGLMYVSDYYYGASPTYWTYPGYTSSSYPDSNGNYGSSYDYRAATGSNWMYMGLNEWTISNYSSSTAGASGVGYSGTVINYFANTSFAVRPSFYLNSNVTYVSGDGSKNLPIRIN